MSNCKKLLGEIAAFKAPKPNLENMLENAVKHGLSQEDSDMILGLDRNGFTVEIESRMVGSSSPVNGVVSQEIKTTIRVSKEFEI